MENNIIMREIKPQIELSAAARDEKVLARAKSLIVELVRNTQNLTKKDIAKWRSAWQIALSVDNPKRALLYDVYDDNVADNHLIGAIRNRKLKVLGKPFKLVDRKTGKENQELTEILKKRWFKKTLSLAMDSIFWGHTLIQLGDLVDDGYGLRFSDVKLVPRRHVCPEFGTLLKNASDEAKKGIQYRKVFADWIIEVMEDDQDLGLLNSLSHQCIAKRNALAFWDQFGEIFGMPVRVGKTLSRDQKDIDKVAEMLEQMGSAAWGVFPEGTEIEIKETTRGDAFNVYDKRIARANSEMSKAILGQTMTMDDGSSKSQAEVHMEVSNEIAAADADFLKDVVNDAILPLLNKHGFKMESVLFDWDESYRMTPMELLEVERMALEYFQVDESYFIEKYNIPIIGPRTAEKQPETQTAQKKKPERLARQYLSLISQSYTSCPDCGGYIITLASDTDELDAEADRIATAIMSGKQMPGNIIPEIVTKVASRLRKALIEGYGSDFPDLDYNTPDFEMLNNLERNVYSFSVAKNYQELKTATGLLRDGDKIRSFNEFRSEVRKLHAKFMGEWLSTEYNTALNSATLAARWVDFQKNKDSMPMLIYHTAGDARVRESHRSLDGVKRTIDDDFWKTYYPPNGWNCRCTVNQSGSGDPTPKKMIRYPQVLPMFRTNLAQSGLVFPQGHAYFIHITDAVISKGLTVLPKSMLVRRIYTSDSGGYVNAHMLHNKKELAKNIETAIILADEGLKIELLPTIVGSENRNLLPEDVYKNKNPDALVDGKVFEFQKHKAGKTAIHNNLREAYKQSDRIVLHLSGNMELEEIVRYCRGQIKRSRISENQLKEVWIIVDNKLHRYSYQQIIKPI